ncbi:hypothetical protein C0389_09970 [bacterium]|nr:hypothetical protein [bacterium]
MKELNILQMEEMVGGTVWGCISATAWAVSTAAAVAGLASSPVSVAVAAAFISSAIAASAAMIDQCT